VQRSNRRHLVEVGRQRAKRLDRLGVERIDIDSEETSDTANQPRILWDDVGHCDVGPKLGARKAVEAKTATHV
jgi:hypothetical protein